MSIVECLSQALQNKDSVQFHIDTLREEIATIIEQSGDLLSLQKQRCAIRFLTRIKQYNEGLGDADFLVSLRDFILFVGRLRVPEHVAMLVRRRGREYGLYMEGHDNTVNAQISEPGWFGNDKFIRQVYGMEISETSQHRPNSCGDALLFRATGFKQYRSFEQKVAIHTALQMPEGHTLLLSLPTGAGKSLLTQMLSSLGEGLTVAVVPTVALGLDQYRAARRVLAKSLRHDQIACYCGDVSNEEVLRMINGILDGSLRLLITSPEAIARNKQLKRLLYQSAENQYIRHLIIDEAHIVQDWGALFRPDFQMISVIRKDMLNLSNGSLKTILLSATLTESTVNSLKSLMSDGECWIELRCDALRTEPRYIIEKCNNQEALQRKIIHLCRTLPKPMILYEIKPEKAEMWKRLLLEEGFSNVVTFTGNTDDESRSEIINNWSEDKLDIVIATSAFGMGVDKPDVRSVVHATLPENMNRFYQEVGRGGRDGLPSLSILCYSPFEDGSMQRYISSSRVMKVENMVDRWFSMLGSEDVEYDGNTVLLNTSTPPSHFTEEEREMRGSQNMRWNLNLLLFLMRYGFLGFEEMIFDPAKTCYFVRVSMRNVELMKNETALYQSLLPYREEEVVSIMSGYQSMKNMVQNPTSICWADYFVDIFRNAAPSCGGCPNHENEYSNDGVYIHNHMIPDYGQALHEPIKNKFRKLLVTRGETEIWSERKALELGIALNSHGFKVLVLPSTNNVDCTEFNGLVVNANEFDHLVSKHPSLFTMNGVICAFDDDLRRNQSQFKSMSRLEELGIPLVYYCRENMFIDQANRTIRHLLNANTLTFDEALEVR